MKTKFIVLIILVVVSLILLLIKQSSRKTQVWRKRFPEFPVEIFEMACGNIMVATDNGMDVSTLQNILNVKNNSSKLCFTPTVSNSITNFIKSWINGIIQTLPRQTIDDTNTSNIEYNLFISNGSSILYKQREYVDNYFLVLAGIRKVKVDGVNHTLTKGDIIYIPKNTDREIICEDNNESQIMLNIKLVR